MLVYSLFPSSVLCLFVLLICVATFHQIWRESYLEKPVDSERDRLVIRVLNCFSAVNNCRKIFSTEEDTRDSLSCLYGIRVLTICWIVVMHIIVELPDRYSYRSKQTAKVLLHNNNESINKLQNGPII